MAGFKRFIRKNNKALLKWSAKSTPSKTKRIPAEDCTLKTTRYEAHVTIKR